MSIGSAILFFFFFIAYLGYVIYITFNLFFCFLLFLYYLKTWITMIRNWCHSAQFLPPSPPPFLCLALSCTLSVLLLNSLNINSMPQLALLPCHFWQSDLSPLYSIWSTKSWYFVSPVSALVKSASLLEPNLWSPFWSPYCTWLICSPKYQFQYFISLLIKTDVI